MVKGFLLVEEEEGCLLILSVFKYSLDEVEGVGVVAYEALPKKACLCRMKMGCDSGREAEGKGSGEDVVVCVQEGDGPVVSNVAALFLLFVEEGDVALIEFIWKGPKSCMALSVASGGRAREVEW